ncbi:hypothetical protein AN958_08104 [Leucoagaricus sp. SymC.cos]|nr:hypothetical protein AN958_08104 [Leucoagaricus sp. SymC.cos]
MSIFPSAQNFVINGGDFGVQVHNSNPGGTVYFCVVLANLTITLRTGMEILLEASDPNAAVDDESRKYAARCFPGTREQYIHDVVHWATASVDETTLPIYWMKGPAGVGKSAISQTCAERVKDVGHLGAAFFFSINGRNDHRRFFPSLAYQLSTILPDYRHLITKKIDNDRLIVRKTMKSQFQSLIVEPLQELEKQGKHVGRRAIFIDGLDECQGNDEQSEIIELIAASVRAHTTPFRWAFFSRPEPHIEAVFDDESISPLCKRALLPISREVDGEIEHYLRGGFKNILRRRNLLSLSRSWPSRGDVQKLVDASAGLFAYPAAVLRFIDCHSFLEFEHTLQAVLSVIEGTDLQQAVSPFAELDALYIPILERVPKDMLSFSRLLLSYLTHLPHYAERWSAVEICNGLGFSEVLFRGLCHQLHAVLKYNDAPEPPDLSALELEITRSLVAHQVSSIRHFQLRPQVFRVFGFVGFHHKSFVDFLGDPRRSLSFCVTTPAAHEILFNHFVDRHHHFARQLVLRDIGLAATPNAPSPTPSLSWPTGGEFVDSFLAINILNIISFNLTHDGQQFPTFLSSLPMHCLQNLNTLDYRKYLTADIFTSGIGLREDTWVVGDESGFDRVIPGAIFSCPQSDTFNPKAFLALVNKLETLGVIKPYYPPATIESQLIEKQAEKCGQYKLGHGDKAVYWYWEFDTESQYFHEFQALDFVEAMGLYQTEKFRMWDESWEPPSQR